MHGGGIRSVKKTKHITSSPAGREHLAAAEQMRILRCRLGSNPARREIREGAERVNGCAHGEEVSQRRHGATSCYATIPILDANMQVQREVAH
jgi:hypothetical protein